MAKFRVFSAHDSKLSIFLPPFFVQHLGQALRMWEDSVNSPDTLVAKHPSDFVLYEIGTFDDEHGVLTSHTPHQRVASALEVIKKPSEPSLPFPSMGAHSQARI